MNAAEIAAVLALHIVETVTPLDLYDGSDGYLIDCKCGQEIRVTQAELDAVDVDSTAGALSAVLAPHAGEALAGLLA